MGFFDEAKHKIEEVVGKVEQTVGGAFGNTAMEVSGEAHAEHGEALLEQDQETAKEQTPNEPSPHEERGAVTEPVRGVDG